jgi:hypothetical protein
MGLGNYINAEFVAIPLLLNTFYMEISFGFGNGVWLSPSDSTGLMQFEIVPDSNLSDVYDQTDDYSFEEIEHPFFIEDYQKITVYYLSDGEWNLVSGVEPEWAR